MMDYQPYSIETLYLYNLQPMHNFHLPKAKSFKPYAFGFLLQLSLK